MVGKHVNLSLYIALESSKASAVFHFIDQVEMPKLIIKKISTNYSAGRRKKVKKKGRTDDYYFGDDQQLSIVLIFCLGYHLLDINRDGDVLISLFF